MGGSQQGDFLQCLKSPSYEIQADAALQVLRPTHGVPKEANGPANAARALASLPGPLSLQSGGYASMPSL